MPKDETLARRDPISDYAGQEAWLNPQTGERHYFVSFPVVREKPTDRYGSVPRSINIDVDKGDVVYDVEITWHPEETSLSQVVWQKTGVPPSPKFRGKVGDLHAHIIWLLAGLWWTLVEVQFKWGKAKSNE